MPARECSDAFARLAEHAAARELTVEDRETGVEALPAIWDDFAAGDLSPEAFLLTSGNYQNLSARTGTGLVLADAPEPLVPSIERGRP